MRLRTSARRILFFGDIVLDLGLGPAADLGNVVQELVRGELFAGVDGHDNVQQLLARLVDLFQLIVDLLLVVWLRVWVLFVLFFFFPLK